MKEREYMELSDRLVAIIKEIRGADMRIQNGNIEGARINIRLVAARLTLMDNELAWYEHEEKLDRKGTR